MWVSFGQITPAVKGLQSITSNVLKAQVGFLASDWTEGRAAGERGEYMAGDYIASMLQLYGLRPGGDYPQAIGFSNIQKQNERTYFQNFILRKTSPGDENVLNIRSAEGQGVKITSLVYNIDYYYRPVNRALEFDAPLVFAGYGFKSDKIRYNDFSRLDLKGKFVLKIMGTPGSARESLSPGELTAAAREAENFMESMGALGVIDINPNSATVGTIPGNISVNLSPSESNPGSSRPRAFYSIPGRDEADTFVRIILSSKAGEELLKEKGIDLNDFIRRSGKNANIVLPVMTGESIYFKTTVKTEALRVRNIIGVIEGSDPDQVIVLGAHYDHLGSADGYIWNGADDNASGTVGVMTLAKAIAECGKKPEKTLIFALWTAEEEGLLGSEYYVDNLDYPLKNLRLNVNFDMISRYIADNDHDKVIMTYTESYPGFRTMTENNLKKYGIGLNVEYQPSKDPPGGSDHRSFVAAGVPVMRFKPGHREEYHTPADEVNTVDWDIMEKIVKIAFTNVWDLANSNW